MKEIRGSCLCGAVEYAVEDDFKYAVYCHSVLSHMKNTIKLEVAEDF
jgi:hypothetical protein